MGVKRNLDQAGLSNKKDIFTEDEAALYDRQIRLWGLDCQRRIREAHILVIGLNGIGAEVVKNLTLTGVKSITILDDTEVSALDNTAQFFVASTEHGKKRSEASLSAIQELNPNVKVVVATGDPNDKPNKFFADYDAIFATCCPMDVLIKINKICRERSVQFYCADTWGFYGYAFLDLISHEFRYLIPKPRDPKLKKILPAEKIYTDQHCCPTVVLPSTGSRAKAVSWSQAFNLHDYNIEYSPLSYTMCAKVGEGLKKRVNKVFILLHIVNHFREMFNRYPLPESRESDIEELKKIREIVCKNLGYDDAKISDEVISSLFGELSPVCTAVGGVLANEMIKGISRTGFPIYNYFLFDGHESVGTNETIIDNKDM